MNIADVGTVALVHAVNVVSKFGDDGYLEGSWVLPLEVIEPLRSHVRMTSEGWIVDEWAITDATAAIVQPWVDQAIDVASDAWWVGSEQVDPSHVWAIRVR
ncbi:hypothetical protein GA0070607_4113 [Micromonospora coriariae]|uniref:Uncharacterized protein n=1 Tax=Micromonospora coriariae TaxID=285665 RepID=A0A1C4WT75_9ACTN|nr:hypothetical protein [Micromonospora coriariae]SCE99390.1 hypothetical protein GA0070607_4113 [Micromonospora coriariae]